MFGVCYYPEHWPEQQWQEDAEMMAGLGLKYVRIGEFAWSRMEPNPGELRFEWLDRAIETLNSAGLEVIIGTPTATPPKWLIDKWPEVLPVDVETGRTRGFGSRRHYDFSSEVYLRESLRITEALVKRYGPHSGVVGWQTDNELCCHDTALSGSESARRAFQQWCTEHYPDIDTLNQAWGNVFWSMEYRNFSEIDLPLGTVIEANPAHCLAYRRFSSDQVVDFHNQMAAIIRRYASDKFLTHNFIPMVDTAVDNFALAEPLDFASYDNYPLGRTDLFFSEAKAEQIGKYIRTGHPDFATYYQDQTRGLTKGGFWIMEQQPGPVNWADNNPRPAPGMIRLWTLEAFAHGADCVCYFRWRQAPFAQEQMHAGLLRPDNSKTETWTQAEQAMAELDALALLHEKVDPARVAIVTGAEGLWLSDIERQGEAYNFNEVQFCYYSALRQLGLNVDFISPKSDFTDYSLIIAPSLPIIDKDFVQRCEQSDASFIFGPRTGAKTQDCGYPLSLPPGPLQKLIPVRILSVETLRSDCPEELVWQDKKYQSCIWREELDAAGCEIVLRYEDGNPAAVKQGNFTYLATLTNTEFLVDFFRHHCMQLGIKTYELGEDIRVRQRGSLLFAFNYSNREQDLALSEDSHILLGERTIKPRDITVWRS